MNLARAMVQPILGGRGVSSGLVCDTCAFAEIEDCEIYRITLNEDRGCWMEKGRLIICLEERDEA